MALAAVFSHGTLEIAIDNLAGAREAHLITAKATALGRSAKAGRVAAMICSKRGHMAPPAGALFSIPKNIEASKAGLPTKTQAS